MGKGKIGKGGIGPPVTSLTQLYSHFSQASKWQNYFDKALAKSASMVSVRGRTHESHVPMTKRCGLPHGCLISRSMSSLQDRGMASTMACWIAIVASPYALYDP
uniref:SFRICE_015111 n=1 Tax=Spodoptera frugiperda TaxID=7108 RepID=A0A2H1WJL8_SPOFR